MTPAKLSANKRYKRTEKGKIVDRRYKQSVAGKRSYRGSRLKHFYNITLAEWEHMFAQQGFCCAACRTTSPGNPNGWHTHHTGLKDNKTLIVHGILCHHCNVAARQGGLNNVMQLRRLADWLEQTLRND